MISNNDASKTTILTQLQGSSYTEAVKKLGKRVVVAPQTCTSFLYPDYKKIDNVDLRRAIAFAYDYENVWSAGGEIPGTTRVMGNSILRSEEHTSELQSLMRISYAVFCLKKKKTQS